DLDVLSFNNSTTCQTSQISHCRYSSAGDSESVIFLSIFNGWAAIPSMDVLDVLLMIDPIVTVPGSRTSRDQMEWTSSMLFPGPASTWTSPLTYEPSSRPIS